MEIKERIQAFNEKNPPFYIVDHEDGRFSLCLPLDTLSDEYYPYCQSAFDAYAAEIGESPFTEQGLKTHGNGYEWQASFCQAFEGDTNLRRFAFDCEAGGFFFDCDDLSLLKDYGTRFKEICEDTEKFIPIVSNGIKRMEMWLAEQEKLMKTVRGIMRQNPCATFDIMTLTGNIRVTPEETKRLLDGDVQFVNIGGVTFATFELLDQEIVETQTDLFDHNFIRIKTEEASEQNITQTM